MFSRLPVAFWSQEGETAVRGRAFCFEALRSYLEEVPLVDCHDHNREPEHRYEDPIDVVANGSDYFIQDLTNVADPGDRETVMNGALSVEQRWPVLEKLWKRTCHTGYAQVVRRVLKRFYGLDALTLEGLMSMEGRLPDLRNEEVYERILADANIVVRLEDPGTGVKQVLDGTWKLWPRNRLVFRITGFHDVRSMARVEEAGKLVGRTVTSLDEYVEACRKIVEGAKRFGAVALKDQSAYTRTLRYGNPTHAQAEAVFNRIAEDPRRSAAYPEETEPLDDYLFHAFMRCARDLDLPVQIHTGQMGGSYNEVAKANAAGLRSVLELHRDVRFDLFHANWPYSGDILFLAKNYPNVRLDFCWANIIDPVYCRRLFEQALSVLPHTKVHAFGSDFGGLLVEHGWAHASIARDNAAIALSELVGMEYVSLDEAKEVARAWFFENANEFFKLGLSSGVPSR